VFALVWAKLRFAGELPADPGQIPFGARLLWQGPFDTCRPTRLYSDLMVGLLALVPVLAMTLPGWLAGRGRRAVHLSVAAVLAAVWYLLFGRVVHPPSTAFLLFGLAVAYPVWSRGSDEPQRHLLALFTLVSVLLTYLIQRLLILPGLLTPVVFATLARDLAAARGPAVGRPRAPGRVRAPGPWLAAALVVAALGLQGTFFTRFVQRARISWYVPDAVAELSRLVRWLREHPEAVPPGEAIAADFTNSTAVLAHTGHPILLQPKYETREARNRAREFFETLILGSLEDVRDYLRRHECRYLLVDRNVVWHGFHYIVGIPDGAAPPPGSAIRTFFSQDAQVLEGVPGLRLLYRSPEFLGTDSYRLYFLEDER
jgi:hypothetical protein